jgi:hypothetical protein
MRVPNAFRAAPLDQKIALARDNAVICAEKTVFTGP